MSYSYEFIVILSSIIRNMDSFYYSTPYYTSNHMKTNINYTLIKDYRSEIRSFYSNYPIISYKMAFLINMLL